MHCALWRGCDGSTYGLIVLRLCRMSTPPANPPVGGCMPVNYCTLREKKRRRKRERERGAQEYEEERRRRSEREREREAPLAVIMKWSVTD